MVATHRISRLVTESALPPYCPPWFLTRRGYIHPSPTALTCYLARREDKSDAEGTVTSVPKVIPPSGGDPIEALQAGDGRPATRLIDM